MADIEPGSSQSFIHQGFSSDFNRHVPSKQSEYCYGSQSFIHQGFGSGSRQVQGSTLPNARKRRNPLFISAFLLAAQDREEQSESISLYVAVLSPR